MPTTGGMPSAFFQHVTPEEDAEVVGALRHAGAVCIGKGNLPDLHLGTSTEASSFGRVKHPYDVMLHAVGSSGGVAAAVASRIAPFGLAVDTAGCSRVPAVLCGVSGFRPTFERYSSVGMLQHSHTLDSPAIIATCVHDIQILDAILKTTGAHFKDHRGTIQKAMSAGVQKLTGKAAVGELHVHQCQYRQQSSEHCGVPRGKCRVSTSWRLMVVLVPVQRCCFALRYHACLSELQALKSLQWILSAHGWRAYASGYLPSSTWSTWTLK